MVRFKLTLTLSVLFSLAACGDDDSCVIRSLINDPSGRWSGRLERVESDCSQSRGTSLSVTHDVSLNCILSDRSEVVLSNEEGLEFNERSFSSLGGGSFEVSSESSRLRVNIRYDNFDGSLADVEQKIRNYRNGEIVCSELYRGQLRR